MNPVFRKLCFKIEGYQATVENKFLKRVKSDNEMGENESFPLGILF
jgi:hypothetical protein